MPYSAVEAWTALRAELARTLPRESYEAWFDHLALQSWEGGRLALNAPNRYAKTWIEEHFPRELLAAARTVVPETEHVELAVQALPSSNPRPLEGILQGLVADVSSSMGLPLRAPPATHRPAPNFTFASFVVGPSNRVAFAACQAVLEGLGQVYNPLVLCGEQGVGKTHLLEALGRELRERRPGQRILVVTCEEFVNGYLRALQDRKLEGFRGEYRRAHALLVDGVHFLAGKERTQEEFLHTYDALLQAGSQLVLTCAAHPREIRRLDERLAARFQSGLLARLTPPACEMRVELVRAKAAARKLQLQDDTCQVIAMRVERVRELEGAVCKLAALAAAEGRPPDHALALTALRELGYLRDGPLSLDEVLSAVARRGNLSPDEIRSDKRLAAFVRARHLAMCLARQLTSFSLSEIGRFFGNRDHATVFHALNKMARELERDAELRAEFELLKRSLGR